MSDAGFELGGLEDLQKDLDAVFRAYPEEASKKTYNLAGKFTKDVNAKFPEGYATGKRSLPKSWKRERERTDHTGYTVSVNVRNTAPHFHLVENGHVKKDRKGKKTIGFVPGKHYCEKTRNEWKDKLPDEVGAFIDKLLKGHGL